MKNEDTLRAKLVKDADGYLALESGDMRINCDFARSIRRIKGGNLGRELLVKAAKIQDTRVSVPLAIDATAGLGEDSLLFAAAGFRVKMFEKNAMIAALLRDGLKRVKEFGGEKILFDAVSRMELVEGDSVYAMREMAVCLGNRTSEQDDITERPDVILLDPMFPEKQKNSLTKKKLQLLQMLEEPCEDEDALLDAAMALEPRRIIIKRPLKGPYLAGRKPTYSLEGKTVRIDCILI